MNDDDFLYEIYLYLSGIDQIIRYKLYYLLYINTCVGNFQIFHSFEGFE